MKYYSHFGHNDFILALGYKAQQFKHYFHNYQEWVSNDHTLDMSDNNIEIMSQDTKDWKITFVDTGLNSNIGQRLLRVREYIKDDVFLANYTDGLTDLDLNRQLKEFNDNRSAVASFMSYNPTLPFHTSNIEEDGLVSSIDPPSPRDNLWINAGYFIFNKKIFDYIKEGEELVHEPLNRLCKEQKLISYKYKGFWKNIDSYKDKTLIDEMYHSGNAPWMLWIN
jgi:glucose-1-phosphate cytidylyltransferase